MKRELKQLTEVYRQPDTDCNRTTPIPVPLCTVSPLLYCKARIRVLFRSVLQKLLTLSTEEVCLFVSESALCATRVSRLWSVEIKGNQQFQIVVPILVLNVRLWGTFLNDQTPRYLFIT